MAPLAIIVATAAAQVRANCPAFEGQLQQGGFIWGQVAPGSRVTLDGEQLDVLEDGTTFAGFGRDAVATAQLVLSLIHISEPTRRATISRMPSSA